MQGKGQFEVGDRAVRRDCDEVKVFLARGNGLGLTDIGHSSHTRVTGLRVGGDTEGSLTLALVEGLESNRLG